MSFKLIPKQSTQSVSRKYSAINQKLINSNSEDNHSTNNLSHTSHNHILQLQSTIGNQATIELLNQTSSKQVPQSTKVSDPIQRRIKPIEGTSSGWFRKGRRDKLNVMVGAYNIKENNSPKTIVAMQALQAEIQKIRTVAESWRNSVQSSSPQKALEITNWIENELNREEAAKGAAIGKASLEDAWENTGFDARFTSPKYTDSGGNAGITWLNTPELANVYKYYVINKQFDAPTVNAYEDMREYAKNPSKAEALRIYEAYSLKDTSLLNITGEGVGGTSAINAVRQQITALKNDENAPIPANFGAIQTSNINVLNEIFSAFSNSDTFKRITGMS